MNTDVIKKYSYRGITDILFKLKSDIRREFKNF